MTLKELIALSETHCSFTLDNVTQTIMTCSKNYSKWLALQSEEGRKLEGYKFKAKSEYARLYKMFRWDWEYDVSARQDIETLIHGEDSYQTIQKNIEICRNKLTVIEGTLKSINSLGFNLKNFIEYEKLKAGY